MSYVALDGGPLDGYWTPYLDPSVAWTDIDVYPEMGSLLLVEATVPAQILGRATHLPLWYVYEVSYAHHGTRASFIRVAFDRRELDANAIVVHEAEEIP